jgi:hypothetical protein
VLSPSTSPAFTGALRPVNVFSTLGLSARGPSWVTAVYVFPPRGRKIFIASMPPLALAWVLQEVTVQFAIPPVDGTT